MIALQFKDAARRDTLARQLAAMGCPLESGEGTDADLLLIDGGSLEIEPENALRLPLPFIVIDGEDSAAAAMRAARKGAIDYFTTGMEDTRVVAGAFEWHRKLVGTEVETPGPASASVFSQARKVAPTDVALLIAGESGSGKEVLARHIHAHSGRRSGPFIAVNCAAIPDNMLEAILFGHEKGAFTGAQDSRPGKFELADGGTLLLDEITEMPTALQAKLLRVLQEKEVERVGARAPRAINVRVVATTNRAVRDAVEKGVLREDLYYRLSVFTLTLPPLRARRAEIPGLARHFLHKHRRLTQPRQVLEVAPEVLEQFGSYRWPGNVRELENVIQRALVLSEGSRIELRDIDLGMTALDTRASELATRMLMAEGETILAALRAQGGKRLATAEALGISERTLRYKLRKLKDLGMEVS